MNRARYFKEHEPEKWGRFRRATLEMFGPHAEDVGEEFIEELSERTQGTRGMPAFDLFLELATERGWRLDETLGHFVPDHSNQKRQRG